MARRRYTIDLAHGGSLELGRRTLVMGILNVTPDSFSDGGRFADAGQALAHALELEAEGADLIDIGGETTRPGAEPIDPGEERRRVVPVIERLAGRLRIPISVDTTRAEVARDALRAGAALINDISGLLYDPALAGVAAAHGAPMVLMHMRGRPRDMYREAVYGDVIAEVAAELGEAIARAQAGGLTREAVILDPGIGFAKRAGHSWRVLAGLDAPAFAALDRPWLAGPSRKSFLTTAAGDLGPEDRDWATAGAVTAAILAGAHIVRVHRVAGLVQAVRVADEVARTRA